MADVVESRKLDAILTDLRPYAQKTLGSIRIGVDEVAVIVAALDERARLSQAGAGGGVVDGWKIVPIEPDELQIEAMRDAFRQARRGGVCGMTIDAQWRRENAPELAAYSAALTAAPTPPATPATPVQPTASVEAVRAALLEAREYAPRRDGIVGRLDAALASLTPAPTQGGGGAKLCQHAPTYDAGLCCGHPDDCTFIRPQAEREEPR